MAARAHPSARGGRTITAETHIKGHKAAASSDNPEYVVESAKTDARAAHKPSELNKA
ncbi:DUF2945 domain-containing protein [Brevundimonas sp.]|uniref:DUF2945 domain-containing protein n=1 Tax=Brevundimonas sp. TaxID=1871086 RepID=UPI003456B1A6